LHSIIIILSILFIINSNHPKIIIIINQPRVTETYKEMNKPVCASQRSDRRTFHSTASATNKQTTLLMLMCVPVKFQLLF